MESETASSYSCRDSIYDEFKLNLLERLVKKTRQEDWEYIAEHPEIRTILRSFLHRVFDRRPADVRVFAAEFAQVLRSEVRNRAMGIHIEGKGSIL